MQRDQIIAFRLSQHHLLKALPQSHLEKAAEAGLQNTVPGTVALSLGVRLHDFTLATLDMALQKKRSLVEITGIRGASYVVPSKDYSLFTTAVFPTHEKDLKSFLGTPAKALMAKISAEEIVDTVTKATLKILNRKSLTQDEIHEEWRKNLSKNFLSWCRGCESFHVNYAVVMAVGLKGCFCFGPIKDGVSAYVRTDQWLSPKDIIKDPETMRRKLVERFLHYYGPATPSGFASWAGVKKNEAKEFWKLIEDEAREVIVYGEPHFILAQDLKALQSPPTPKGVILLPPRDAYLNLPDREMVVPEPKHIPLVWKVLGNPGVVIVDGEIAALWKFQKKQRLLLCQFRPLKKISAQTKKDAANKAEALVGLRECSDIQIKWE